MYANINPWIGGAKTCDVLVTKNIDDVPLPFQFGDITGMQVNGKVEINMEKGISSTEEVSLTEELVASITASIESEMKFASDVVITAGLSAIVSFNIATASSSTVSEHSYNGCGASCTSASEDELMYVFQ